MIRRRALLKNLGVAAAATAVPAHLRSLAGAGAGLRQDGGGIAVNQVGYLPGQKKVATVLCAKEGVSSLSREAAAFRVRSVETSSVVLTGRLTAPVFDPLSGGDVCRADLSALTTSGRYRVEVMGASSDTFAVRPDVYAEALRLTMRAFYGQRCGCAVDLGEGYRHTACHGDGQYSATAGRSGKVADAGGWHDAGDYGRYVVNSGITCGTLLWAWELFPDAVRGLALDLPESGKGLPDFLAEVKWNLEWMLAMQDPADGGVWHKQTSLKFCGFVMPEKDRLPSEIIGTGAEPYKSTGASGDLAAVMAIAARCYRPFDGVFAERCLVAARRAFAWCRSHPEVRFKNPASVSTGEYGDRDCADEMVWAAAELYRTTREAAYEATLLEALKPLLLGMKVEAPSWSNVDSMGLWSYALAVPGKRTPPVEAIRRATQAAAAAFIERYQRSGFGHTLVEANYGWGSNSVACNQSLLLLMANHFEADRAAVDAALANLHYLLGRNCLGVSWVTHVGARPFLHPHHRPSVADGVAAPWPGLLSGGPNARGGDPVANLLAKTAPMRMWVDDERAYSLNEVAINWNAPLVFLLAAANSRLHV